MGGKSAVSTGTEGHVALCEAEEIRDKTWWSGDGSRSQQEGQRLEN